MQYFDLLLALVGIGFLIFIHELGHYWMAKWVGMKVETFSIGFGRPLFSWNFQNVKWQIGWIPFGGYVKIQGMDLTEDKNPYETPGSFYHSPPWDRIKVSFMGPMANFLLALLFFFFIWVTGGRQQDFSYLTPQIGWVDPQSELYAEGVRPGDEVIAYSQDPFKNFTDHLKAPLLSPDMLTATIRKMNEDPHTTHDYTVKPYALKRHGGLKSIGVLESARYLIMASSDKTPFLPSSMLENAGAKEGDRIVWMDGEEIFSKSQLEHLLNDARTLMVVQRGNQRLLRRVPFVRVEELKLTNEMKAEISDWQHEAHLEKMPIGKLYAIPYDLDAECRIQSVLSFIDPEEQQKTFPAHSYSDVEESLQEGDQIISIAGRPVKRTYQLFADLQSKQVLMMVQRGEALQASDIKFTLPLKEIEAVALKIASLEPVEEVDSVYLLKPIVPKSLKELYSQTEYGDTYVNLLDKAKEEIEKISDADLRASKLKEVEAQENQLMLGVALVDRKVQHNPTPLALFSDSIHEVSSTFVALISGSLSTENISGPIGIVQTIQHSARDSFKQLLFWLGFISVNLGFLNLLPVPVLDGGYIALFLYEMATRKRLNPKVVEKMMIPFVILLIGFLLYVSFNDILRIVTG